MQLVPLGEEKIMPAVLQLSSFLCDFDMDLEQAFQHPRIDMSGIGTAVIDQRLDEKTQNLIGQDHPFKRARKTIYPYHFACPTAVMRRGGTNSGMTEIMSPWADCSAAGFSMKASGNPNLRTPIKHMVKSSGGLVTAQHWLAAQAGANALSNGANAIDAAVTAAFSLSVVEPWSKWHRRLWIYDDILRERPKGTYCQFWHQITATTQSGRLSDCFLIMTMSGFNWPKVKDDRNLFGYPSICVPSFIAGFVNGP